jgi:hypothetical protein
VRVVGLALGGVRVEVVVVVGERRQDQAVAFEGAADPLGLGAVEGIGRYMRGGEGAVADRRPGG